MQGTNPIRKLPGNTWSYGHGQARQHREWMAVCPNCGEELRCNDGMYWGISTRASRKAAKDALYRHGQEHHKPGLVGTL
jgi:hypothetical protein